MGLKTVGVSVFSAAVGLTPFASGSLSTSAIGGHTGEIVFTSNRDGNAEIYVLRSSGSVQTRLTNNVVEDRDAAFSPDGVIAFVRQTGETSELFTVQPVTRQKKRLMAAPGTASDPAWSPGGTRLAFTVAVGGNADIAVVSTTPVSGPVNLTDDPAQDTEPTWSPDGSKIAFVSTRSGNRDIWVMNNDGSHLLNLTADSADEFDPDWGADGRILFARTEGAKADVWVMQANGSGQQPIVTEPANDVEPRWSPDQQRIAFATDQDGNYEIYIAFPDGSHALDASNSVPGNDRDPSWQTVVPTSALPAHGITPDTGRVCLVNGLRTADADLQARMTGGATCGNGGNDVIYGGPGNDVLWGDAGRDTIYGDFGDDALHGGPGNDRLYGGRGRDRIFGDAGNDTIYARDGVAEAIYGGPGHNVAHVDPGDDVYNARKIFR